jgi:hypothetical protein
MNLLTRKQSPIKMVVSMDPVGTMNASTTNDRMSSTAMMTGPHSANRRLNHCPTRRDGRGLGGVWLLIFG